MAMNRWVKSAWSTGRTDDSEEEKIRFLMSRPEDEDYVARIKDNDTKARNSRNKLIEMLGAEYLSLVDNVDTDMKPQMSGSIMKPAIRKKGILQKKAFFTSKPDILEEDEDEIDKNEDLELFAQYHHMGVSNWGEDNWRERKKSKKYKRRMSAPLNVVDR